MCWRAVLSHSVTHYCVIVIFISPVSLKDPCVHVQPPVCSLNREGIQVKLMLSTHCWFHGRSINFAFFFPPAFCAYTSRATFWPHNERTLQCHCVWLCVFYWRIYMDKSICLRLHSFVQNMTIQWGLHKTVFPAADISSVTVVHSSFINT